jgi:hypothetical protein
MPELMMSVTDIHVFFLGLIAANVAELFWTSNERPLASVSFLWMQSFVAKGLEFACCGAGYHRLR